MVLKIKKEPDMSNLPHKKFQKALIKIDKMADVFTNSGNFTQHIYFTLGPPSSYSLNLKALNNVSKVT